MKLLLFLFIVVMFISPAFAGIHTKTIGIDGDAFYENVTVDSNITTVHSTGNIEMQSVISDYYLKLRMDEGSGTTIHDENRSHTTSTFTGTPTWVGGGGIEFFANLSNYITVNSMNGAAYPNGYTLICDFKPDDILGRAYTHQYNGATDTDSISIDTSGGNLRGIMQKSNTNYATYYGISGGNQYHAALTYDNETLFLIVNGVEKDNNTNPSGVATTMNTDMYIGKFSSSILPTDGIIYSVSVFSRNLSISEINSLYNNEHKLFGNVSTGTTDLGSGNVFSGAGFNATLPNSSTVNIYINTSSTGITLLKANASKDTIYLANATNKEQIYNVTYEITSTNTSETIKLENILIQWEGDAAPSITSSSPSTPTTSFVNESKTFNAGSDQSGNWTWLLDSILMKNTETNTANATYTNSTAPNGTVYNVTAIITNVNGSTQTSWNWTTLENYITANVTYSDGTNSTIVHIVNVSYYTPGTSQWGFNFSWTDTGQQYDWTYTNGTIIQSLTASSTNETLEFLQPTLPTGIYYIQKASAVMIETFIVAVGAFAAVVVASAAVVSRRVRRGISGFWNRRIRRR
jgi:hypothetical protein